MPRATIRTHTPLRDPESIARAIGDQLYIPRRVHVVVRIDGIKRCGYTAAIDPCDNKRELIEQAEATLPRHYRRGVGGATVALPENFPHAPPRVEFMSREPRSDQL